MALVSRLFRSTPTKRALKEEKTKYKQGEKMFIDCGLIFREGIAKAEQLRCEDKVKHLKMVKDVIEQRALQSLARGVKPDSYDGRQVTGMIKELGKKIKEAERESLREKTKKIAIKGLTREEMEFMRKIKSPTRCEVFRGEMSTEGRIVKKADSIFKKGMAKAQNMHSPEREKFLEKLEDDLYRYVLKTYDPRAKDQSDAHKKISDLLAQVTIEKFRKAS